MKLEILHQDDKIVVLNKPTGLLSAPGRDPSRDNLKDLLQTELNQKIYLVHRLDQDTSGVMVFAKDENTHRFLNAAFANREVDKTYLALCAPVRELPAKIQPFDVDLPLSAKPDPTHHRVSIDYLSGKTSMTAFEAISVVNTSPSIEFHPDQNKKRLGFQRMEVKTPKKMVLFQCKPKTGRTHQIRVHLEASGYPILCDHLYGIFQGIFTNNDGDLLSQKMCLHAVELTIPNPNKKGPMTFTAPVPRRIQNLMGPLDWSMRVHEGKCSHRFGVTQN